MNPDELCICGHTQEVHFGGNCSQLRCRCKEFALIDAGVEIFEALKRLTALKSNYDGADCWDEFCIGDEHTEECQVVRSALEAGKAAIRKAKGE